MRKEIVLLIMIIILSGCAKEQAPPSCAPPRITYEGECCLDTDNSGVCDIIEEALKRAKTLEGEQQAEIKQEKVPDTCLESNSKLSCEDVDISYDPVLQRGLISLQLKNNRDGRMVIKSIKFPGMPLCTKNIDWNSELTGILPGQSEKYVIGCNDLSKIDVLESFVEIDTSFYEKLEGIDADAKQQYMPTGIDQVVKLKIKGSP
ncbi:hypothetical protein FJZ53_07305 [Candidatus Woesearchaeota archaeon]|nr:hypothetical protein [Candidatus Woesearchaeota archaeon]